MPDASLRLADGQWQTFGPVTAHQRALGVVEPDRVGHHHARRQAPDAARATTSRPSGRAPSRSASPLVLADVGVEHEVPLLARSSTSGAAARGVTLRGPRGDAAIAQPAVRRCRASARRAAAGRPRVVGRLADSSVPGSQASINALPTVARRPEASTAPITASVWCTESMTAPRWCRRAAARRRPSWAEAAIDASS